MALLYRLTYMHTLAHISRNPQRAAKQLTVIHSFLEDGREWPLHAVNTDQIDVGRPHSPTLPQ